MEEADKPLDQTNRTLVVRSTPDGFEFGRMTTRGVSISQLRLFALVDFPDTFETFLRENHWCHRPDLSVTLIDHTDRFMLIPSEFSDDETIRECLKFQCGAEPEQQIYTAPMDEDRQTFCWEIESSRDLVFEKLFPDVNVWSSAYLLAEWTANRSKATSVPVLTAHFYGHRMHLFAAQAGRLTFANTFPTHSSEEICYFLFRTIEQLSYDPVTLVMDLCTETIPFAELEAFLSPYLSNLHEAVFTMSPGEPVRLAENVSNTPDEGHPEFQAP